MGRVEPAVQLESVSRALELPVVEMAVAKSAETYARVRESHQLVGWALATAESGLGSATRQAARTLGRPISFFDHTICRGLDAVERRAPIVKETPDAILESAYMKALESLVLPASAAASSGWNRLSGALGSTPYGRAAVLGLDGAAARVDELLDKYLPAAEEDPEYDHHEDDRGDAPEDQLLHALRTVGRLSGKAARRVRSRLLRALEDG